MRKRIWILAVVCAAMLACLTACGQRPEEPAPPSESGSVSAAGSEVSEAVAFTDDLGREVSVAAPERVAAMIGSFADVWCLAGGQGTLVAAAGDAWTSFDLGLDDSVLDLGGVKEPNLEVLLSARPDLVLASCNTAADLELLETLDQAGIAAAYFDIQSFDDYLRMLEICVRLTGCPQNFERYGTQVQKQVEEAVARQHGEPPRILCMRTTGSSCKVKGSVDFLLGEMLADLGCANIADSETGLLEELSLEVILAQDPDFIFAVVQGSDPTRAQDMLDKTLLSNPAWQSLTAVKEGRFHVMEHRLYNLKPNAYWGDAYENLANILYP